MMRSILKYSILPGVLAATLAGCFVDGSAGYQATVTTPQPVYADPNVQVQAEVVEAPYVEPASYVYVAPEVTVIEDYDEPVFLNAGLYWRYENNVWYSSSYHDRGWVESREVPEHIRSIDRPAQYTHYHGNVSAHVGEAGYVDHSVHVAHSAPPPKYVEHPPQQRGGQNYRPAPVRAQPAGYQQPNRGGEYGHGPAQPGPRPAEPTHNTGYQQQHPSEPAPRPAEPTHNTGYQAPTHSEPAPRPAEPTHNTGYQAPTHSEPAPRPAEPTHNTGYQQPTHSEPAPRPAEPAHNTYQQPAHQAPAPAPHGYNPAPAPSHNTPPPKKKK